jgi:Glycosyltransferase like family
MIAFGCSILSPSVYRGAAEKGIRLAAEPDSVVLAHAAAGSVARSYNLMLERARTLDDLEALVLVHQDAEIVDPEFSSKLRAALRYAKVGVVGCVGAIGADNIAWWEGAVTWDAYLRCYPAVYGDEIPALSLNRQELPPSVPMGEVETLDGFLLALSPWAVRDLRFDESLGPMNGYDADFCHQVREVGGRVVTADLEVIHHHPTEFITDPETWMEAHMLLAEKWAGRLAAVNGHGIDWKQRARRSEAEAGVARLAGASALLQTYASGEEHQAAMRGVTETPSWRLTEPLRRLNARRRARGRAARARTD